MISLFSYILKVGESEMRFALLLSPNITQHQAIHLAHQVESFGFASIWTCEETTVPHHD